MINKRIEDKHVRVEKTAMLQNPTDKSQTEFLFFLSMLDIEAKMTDWGDVTVERQFTNELVVNDIISQRMEDFIWVQEVDKIVFVHNYMVR